MNRNYIAFNEVTITAAKPEMIIVPGANFLRCLASSGRRFLLSIDGEPAVPCWGGWYFGVGATETVSRLVVSLLPGDTEPLHVEFMHGLGIFDDKQLQIVHDYAVASKIRMAVPTRSEMAIRNVGGSASGTSKLMDEDDNAQEVIIHYFPYLLSGNTAHHGNVGAYIDFKQSEFGSTLYRLALEVVANDDPRRSEYREVRLKYGGALWLTQSTNHITPTTRQMLVTRLLLNES